MPWCGRRDGALGRRRAARTAAARAAGPGGWTSMREPLAGHLDGRTVDELVPLGKGRRLVDLDVVDHLGDAFHDLAAGGMHDMGAGLPSARRRALSRAAFDRTKRPVMSKAIGRRVHGSRTPAPGACGRPPGGQQGRSSSLSSRGSQGFISEPPDARRRRPSRQRGDGRQQARREVKRRGRDARMRAKELCRRRRWRRRPSSIAARNRAEEPRRILDASKQPCCALLPGERRGQGRHLGRPALRSGRSSAKTSACPRAGCASGRAATPRRTVSPRHGRAGRREPRPRRRAARSHRPPGRPRAVPGEAPRRRTGWLPAAASRSGAWPTARLTVTSTCAVRAW